MRLLPIRKLVQQRNNFNEWDLVGKAGLRERKKGEKKESEREKKRREKERKKGERKREKSTKDERIISRNKQRKRH